jgi:hypothetical protein
MKRPPALDLTTFVLLDDAVLAGATEVLLADRQKKQGVARCRRALSSARQIDRDRVLRLDGQPARKARSGVLRVGKSRLWRELPRLAAGGPLQVRGINAVAPRATCYGPVTSCGTP